jgi:hypothetical protein
VKEGWILGTRIMNRGCKTQRPSLNIQKPAKNINKRQIMCEVDEREDKEEY